MQEDRIGYTGQTSMNATQDDNIESVLGNETGMAKVGRGGGRNPNRAWSLRDVPSLHGCLYQVHHILLRLLLRAFRDALQRIDFFRCGAERIELEQVPIYRGYRNERR